MPFGALAVCTQTCKSLTTLLSGNMSQMKKELKEQYSKGRLDHTFSQADMAKCAHDDFIKSPPFAAGWSLRGWMMWQVRLFPHKYPDTRGLFVCPILAEGESYCDRQCVKIACRELSDVQDDCKTVIKFCNNVAPRDTDWGFSNFAQKRTADLIIQVDIDILNTKIGQMRALCRHEQDHFYLSCCRHLRLDFENFAKRPIDEASPPAQRPCRRG